MSLNTNAVEPILLGKGEDLQYLLPAFGNRHGLITGATGTGKTVTLQILADRRARFPGRCERRSCRPQPADRSASENR